MCQFYWHNREKPSNKYHTAIPAIIDGNSFITEPKEKADLFNNYFASQSCIPNSETAEVPLLVPCSLYSMDSILADEEIVYNLLSTVNVAKACGYDGISNRIIKFCSAGLCKVFTRLINLSISFGQFPSAWKIANVLPLFKKDNRQLKFNYRPVSLLSCLSKICERVVFIHLYDFRAEIGFFYKFQSGFRPGDSTEMQLFYIVHRIYEALERGHEVRAVFLDISKAFDTVWHRGLLAKLSNRD